MGQPHAEGGPEAYPVAHRIKIDGHGHPCIAGKVGIILKILYPCERCILRSVLVHNLIWQKLWPHADILAGNKIEAVEAPPNRIEFIRKVCVAPAAFLQSMRMHQVLLTDGRKKEILEERVRPRRPQVERGARLNAQPRLHLASFERHRWQTAGLSACKLSSVRLAPFGNERLEGFDQPLLVLASQQQLILLLAPGRQQHRFERVHLVLVPSVHLAGLAAIAGLWLMLGRQALGGPAVVLSAGAFGVGYIQRIPVGVRFFPVFAIAGVSGSLVPLLGAA